MNTSTAPPTVEAPVNSEVASLKAQLRLVQDHLSKIAMGNNGIGLLTPQDVKPLPANFKMPEIEKFDGSTCPRVHIQSYVLAMGTKGCDEAEMAQCFHMTLKSPADAWYLDLKSEERDSWEQIKAIFLEKYKGNMTWKVTREDVLATTQRPNESITDFYARWCFKATQLKVALEEDDQKRVFMSCIKPSLRKAIERCYYPNVREIVNAGSWEEHQAHINGNASQSVNTGYRYRAQSTPKGQEGDQSQSINNIQTRGRQGNTQQFPERKSFQSRQPRFDDIGMTPEEAFHGLVNKQMISPATNWVTKPDADMTKFCHYHQGYGHVTNDCFTLKKIIQGLVDAKKIAAVQKPNTVTNPLPGTINMIEFGGYINMLEFGEAVPTTMLTRSKKRKADAQSEGPRLRFKVDDIGMSAGKWFDDLVSQGRMEPMGGFVTAADADMTQYCRFHQIHGHDIEDCTLLREIIQKHRASVRLFLPLDSMGMEEIFDKLVLESMISPITQFGTELHGDMSEYCCFHQRQGHDISECAIFKHVIKQLVERGLLSKRSMMLVGNLGWSLLCRLWLVMFFRHLWLLLLLCLMRLVISFLLSLLSRMWLLSLLLCLLRRVLLRTSSLWFLLAMK